MTQRFPEIVGEAFDVLHQEGGRTFGLHVHPWLFGMPYRTHYFDATLARLAKHGNVWQSTAGDVAKHAAAALTRNATR